MLRDVVSAGMHDGERQGRQHQDGQQMDRAPQPQSRIVWMKNELIATISVSVTHDQPIRRCGIGPFGAVS